MGRLFLLLITLESVDNRLLSAELDRVNLMSILNFIVSLLEYPLILLGEYRYPLLFFDIIGYKNTKKHCAKQKIQLKVSEFRSILVISQSHYVGNYLKHRFIIWNYKVK
ncbi:hypothetical protein [Hoylesella marshii]|uniref:Uncharacterized protein n=1 Tax=Hoylesella marshii DSM 16973 = JCM 13450 TaxID=862515 RepID=E0NQ80_9BACT|nr:hypothetical protein [Hoylesella marshii]EFM02726.1 hypothetical protein HMPREF0658_0331 [Hoylesella marshii DSM 16973 = JCM 13450]